MLQKTSIYRRNLPHIHPDGYPIFVTFNLIDSLPAEVVKELKARRENEIKTAKSEEERYNIHKRYFARYDEWLDRCENSPRWLGTDDIAQIVAHEIGRLDKERYFLMAYCIMPNHVHLLINALPIEQLQHNGRTANYPIADSMRFIKGRSARFCNLKLHREGGFWHHESYDHYARNEAETTRIIHYIINNPVKAGLVKHWKDWKFTYVSPELGEW